MCPILYLAKKLRATNDYMQILMSAKGVCFVNQNVYLFLVIKRIGNCIYYFYKLLLLGKK